MGAGESFDEQYRLLNEFRRDLAEWWQRKQDLEQAAREIREQGDQGNAVLLAEYERDLCRMRWKAVSLYRHGRELHRHAGFVLRRAVRVAGDSEARQRLEDERTLLDAENARLRPVRVQGRSELLAGPADGRPSHLATRGIRPAVPSPRASRTGHPGPVGERNSRNIPQDVKIAVAARDGGKCRQCGSAEDLHYDHVIPWSKGGSNTVRNIQLLCGTCNRRKGADDIPALNPHSPAPSPPVGRPAVRTPRPVVPRGSLGAAGERVMVGSAHMPTADEAGELALGHLSVKKRDDGMAEVHGEAQNSASKCRSSILRARFYDGAGKIMATSIGGVYQVGPGEAKLFTIRVRDDVWGCETLKVDVHALLD